MIEGDAVRIARRLPLMALFMGLTTPLPANGVLQCVPYAREISGVRIRGDAWTWWHQAEGVYARGFVPRPGAVIALANTPVMPLGHVAVVSRILDERHILLRHANWSSPGQIEEDVLAVDSSDDNDWSRIRIWWGQTQQMGARDNPVNGFIYPDLPPTLAVAEAIPDRQTPMDIAPGKRIPRLLVDTGLFRAQDNAVTISQPRNNWALAAADGGLRRP